ncbi:Sodium-independent sulfate anion transporter [Frankliniella fusca]|uniref:Sodium-independent sulfate anion transporter n=1 Tax=Frankliniella fusca TaxID=407009 RepID=A0AAE1HUM2_9NEOP|nr:Sodium-independent sulfate anion transporter [Frankliniella fusca]
MMKVVRLLSLATAVVAAATFASAAHLPAADENPYALPDNFLIGAGVSAIQTEGAWDADGKKESASDHVLHLGKLGSLGFTDPHQHDVAADSYHRYKEDVAMAKQLGLQVYRFSISWGRVYYEGVRNEVGIQYYHNLIKEIKDNGMRPLVTVYHFDHPQVYEDEFKGWQSPKMVEKFEQYTKFIFSEYGSEVDLWVTMNEPNMYCPYFGQMFVISGLYTEQEANMYDCMRNLVLGHAKSYRAFKDGKYQGQIGVNAIIIHAAPNSTRPEDVHAAELFNEVFAGQILGPAVHGDFPQVLKDELGDKITEFTDDEKQLLRGSTDFIGFNVYYSMVASYKDPSIPTPFIPIMGKLIEDLHTINLAIGGAVDPTNPLSMFQTISPEALRDALLYAWEHYKVPLMITENGFGDSTNVGKHDHIRASYHSAYMRTMVTTMKEFDIPVIGYCAWSLIDSFEWSAGFGRPFGLVHVDYEGKTLDRSLKDSSEFWIELSKTRAIPIRDEPTTPAPTSAPAPTPGTSTQPPSSTTPKSSATFISTCLLLQVCSAVLSLPPWLRRRVPLLAWLPSYSSGAAVADLIAGLTLGVTMMPQSIAYAHLANVSPEYGLYSAFAGGFVYMFLGTIRQVAIGPASIMSIITLQFTRDKPIPFVHLLTFFTGVGQFVMLVLRLGFLVDFISAPVVSAFTSATAIIIMVAQLRPLLGLSFRAHGCVETLVGVVKRAADIRPGDLTMGLTSIAFLVAFKGLALVRADPKKPLGRGLWFLSICKNGLCLTLATVAAGMLHRRLDGGVPFAVVGNMPPGLPAVTLPPFQGIQVGNQTYSFPDMMGELGVGLVVTPVVAVLINIAIGKAYAGAAVGGGGLDASQELLALSACNLLGALVQGMPVSGALTRSAVAEASGVRTPLAGLYCSALIVAALAWLTPSFYFIPRPTLAAVLIVAVSSLIDVRIVPRLWRVNKRDFVVLVVTFFTCLWLGVEVGLVVGMAMDATRLLQPWARPSLDEVVKKSPDGHEYMLVRPSLGMLYPGVDTLHEQATRAAATLGRGELAVVVDCSSVVCMDYSAAVGLVTLADELGERGQRLILLGARPSARSVLIEAGLDQDAFCEEDSLLRSLRGNDADRDILVPAPNHRLLPRAEDGMQLDNEENHVANKT